MKHLLFFLSKLNKKEIFKISQLILNSFITGILEIVSMTSLIPVLHVVLKVENEPPESDLFKKLFNFIDMYLPQLNNIIYACLFFIIIFFIKNLFIFIFFRSHVKFSKHLEIKFSNYIINLCIKKNFNFFLMKKKSEFITLFANEVTESTRNYIGPLLILFTEIITMSCFLIIFIFVGQLKLILIFLFYFFFGVIILKILSQISKKIGKTRADTSEKKFFILNNIFSNIRYLILENKRSYFFNLLKRYVVQLAEVHEKFTVISIVPRILMELIGIISILTIVIYLTKINYNTSDLIILSGLFLMATYRIVPSFNKIIGSYNQLTFSSHALNKVFFDDQNKEDEGNQENINEIDNDLQFESSFELKKIGFKYPSNERFVLKDLNLKINKGEKIGIFGYSGVGKSTLVDIISTLNKPTTGEILIDNEKLINSGSFKAWQNEISYVSQNSVLLDDTIKNNITFFQTKYLDETDMNRKLDEVINNAQLSKFIKKLPKGLETNVGDLGNRLSGGQIQRIAIARALYKDKQFLILDEPTSALDKENEQKIIKSILNQDKTIILISHDLDNLKNCDHIYELKEMKIFLKVK